MVNSLGKKKKIIVCIPAYNESKNIGKIVSAAKKYATEVIVCDDGSIDHTTQVAKSAGAIVIRHNTNKGYGSAIRTLFQNAKERNADVMVTMDSDGQHDPNQIPIITESLFSAGSDIVIGSRFLTKSDKKKVPGYRALGIKTITKLTNVGSYKKLTDAQSGFRAYSKNALSKIELFESGMSVSTEILLTANEKNLEITEVPISVNYDIDGSSKQNSVSHGVEVLLSVLRFVSVKHPLSFYSLPGILLLFISIGFMGWALELFAETRFISTNMILISVGTVVIGVVFIATGIILYTMTQLIRGKIKDN